MIYCFIIQHRNLFTWIKMRCTSLKMAWRLNMVWTNIRTSLDAAAVQCVERGVSFGCWFVHESQSVPCGTQFCVSWLGVVRCLMEICIFICLYAVFINVDTLKVILSKFLFWSLNLNKFVLICRTNRQLYKNLNFVFVAYYICGYSFRNLTILFMLIFISTRWCLTFYVSMFKQPK